MKLITNGIDHTNAGDFKCTTPLTCNSTRPQHTLQVFADHYGPRQTIPWETINQGLLQPQGELYPIQTILTIAAGISSLSFVRVSTRQLAVSSLSKGISSTLNFHKSNGTDRTRTRNLSHPASVYSDCWQVYT